MAKKKSATLSRASARSRVPAPAKAAQRPATAPTAGGVTKLRPVSRQRMTYSQSFKLEVVRHSLRLPATARIKPTCRAFPGIEPVQIRKWIRNLAPLALLVEQQQAGGGQSGAKSAPRAPGSDQPTRLPPPEREGAAKASNKAAPSRAAKPSARNRCASPGNRMYPLPIRLGPSLLSNQYGSQFGSQYGNNPQFCGNPQFGGGNHQFYGFSPPHQQTSGPMHSGYGVVQHQAGAPPGYPPAHLQRAADVAKAPAPLPFRRADGMEFEEAAKDLFLLRVWEGSGSQVEHPNVRFESQR
jgi:transposase-like protein